MKNLKKILILVLLVCALAVGLVIGAFAEDYTGTIEELNAKVDGLQGNSTSLSSFDSVAAYLATVDPASDGYSEAVAALNAKALLAARAYLDLVASETVESTARNQIALNNFNALIKLDVFDTESAEYAALMADAEARIKLQEDAKEANRQAMLAEATLESYGYATMYNTDFSDGKNPFPTLGNPGSSIVSTDGKLTINYDRNSAATNTYVQGSYVSGFTSKGVVIDFDFATFGNFVGGNGFHLEGGGHEALGDGDTSKVSEKWSSGLPKIYASYFKIEANGNLRGADNSSDGAKVFIQNTITKGEWLHYTIIFNNENFTYSLYCEYEHIATYSAKVHGFHYNLSAIRFAGSTNSGEWSIDNLQVYQGTALRELGMFDRMTNEEKFVYYANYYTNDASTDILGRYTAQKSVDELIGLYSDEEGNFKPFEQGELSTEEYEALLAKVQTAYEKVAGFDNSGFINHLKESNRDIFIGYVNDAAAITRELNSANIETRKKAVSKIEEFILSTDGIVDDNDAYKAAFNVYAEIQRQRYADENTLVFNKYMEVYSKIETLTALRKYYKLAYAIFNDASYPLDPADTELPGFEAFAAAYELYSHAEARIESVERDQNSKKIISCYEIVSVYAPEVWEENYDFINPYVVMIRQTIKDDYFNYDHEGIDETIAAFAPMDEFFYGLLQEVHIAEITARLDYVYNNDAYIEKMGTLSYITRYLENNDIDRTRPEMATLITNYQTALEELEFRREDYETVLDQNASYFVALVEKMRISNDFNEKRELHAMASGFYFAINANYPGAKEAIAVFDEHTIYFENGERSSNLFLDAVVILRAAETNEEKYAALVDCYIYSIDAVLTYTGVAEAMEYYTAEYNAYNGSATATIEVIENIGVAVGSVRANCGVSSIIAVIIKKIFD